MAYGETHGCSGQSHTEPASLPFTPTAFPLKPTWDPWTAVGLSVKRADSFRMAEREVLAKP